MSFEVKKVKTKSGFNGSTISVVGNRFSLLPTTDIVEPIIK